MQPTYSSGDWLLVRRWGRARAGDVVVVQLPHRPLSVKRLRQVDARGRVWVEGDAAAQSTDSRQLGWLDATALQGVVLCRYRRGI
jgi:signal peptidase I